jgi:hypothetical protein
MNARLTCKQELQLPWRRAAVPAGDAVRTAALRRTLPAGFFPHGVAASPLGDLRRHSSAPASHHTSTTLSFTAWLSFIFAPDQIVWVLVINSDQLMQSLFLALSFYMTAPYLSLSLI